MARSPGAHRVTAVTCWTAVELMTARDGRPAAWQMLGSVIRRERKAKGLSSDDIANQTHYARALLSMVETGARFPSTPFLTQLEDALGTDGWLTELRAMADSENITTQPDDLMDLKVSAASIRSWHPIRMPGIAQAEPYARATMVGGIFAGMSDHEVNERAATRARSTVQLFAGPSRPEFVADVDQDLERKDDDGCHDEP